MRSRPAEQTHSVGHSVANDKRKHTIGDLLDVMAALRTPGTGCPWDLEQTFQSIAPYTLEEAYEVADAIERGDLVDMKEELGDLLLQVAYHARMAEEEGAFDFHDVADAITRKMIRRHPHVFGTPEERAQGAQPGFWERIKAGERTAKAEARREAGLPEPAERESVLDDVPVGLPALVRAIKLQNKAAKVGFDWPSLAPVLDKMREELAELDEAIGRGERDAIEDEFGDLLFVMANVARHLNIDAETSLRRTNEKFVRRFQSIEDRLHERGRTPAQSSLEEMDALWDAAKAEEKTRS